MSARRLGVLVLALAMPLVVAVWAPAVVTTVMSVLVAITVPTVLGGGALGGGAR